MRVFLCDGNVTKSIMVTDVSDARTIYLDINMDTLSMYVSMLGQW